MAQPGEFTRRAFLNGRIDLAQAEAVLDLVTARDADEVRAAAAQLRGAFSRGVRSIEASILDLCADAEAAIDFIDQDIEIISNGDVARRAAEARGSLRHLIESTSSRRIATSKPTVFLVGPPNAGKSALFNRMGGSSIVSEAAGTTRDVIAADLDSFRLLDAPGLWEADGLDATAVARASAEADHADLWLFVVDAGDLAPAERLADRVKNRPAILVLNKVDRVPKPLDMRRNLPIGETLCTSAVTGEGVPALMTRLHQWARGTGQEGSQARFHVSLRQMGELRDAETALVRAGKAASEGLGMEFVSHDLRAALMAMGAVTGRHVNDDLLDRIFERFCLGK